MGVGLPKRVMNDIKFINFSVFKEKVALVDWGEDVIFFSDIFKMQRFKRIDNMVYMLIFNESRVELP